jgi:hypothetical protein
MELNMILKKKKEYLINYGVFFLLLIPITYLNWYLFYRQSVRLNDLFHSDMYAYTMYLKGNVYNITVPYPIFFFTEKVIYKLFFRNHFLGAELGTAIATLIYEIFGLIVSKVVLDFLLLDTVKQKFKRNHEIYGGLFISFLALAINYVSMLFLTGNKLGFWRYRFSGVYSPNLWHNSTYITAKPFTILAFLSFVILFERIIEKRDRLFDYIFFSVSLSVSTLAKPSYTIAFGASAALLTLVILIIHGKATILQDVYLFISTVPTLAILVYQYLDVYLHSSRDEDGGLGIAFALIWGEKCNNIPMAILMACFFPLISLLFNAKRLKSNIGYLMSWIQFIFAALMFLLFYEKGFKIHDGNFQWGYCHSLFFLFFMSLILLVEDSFSSAEKTSKGKVAIAIQWIAFLMHLIAGIAYYASLMTGVVYS